VGRVEGDGFPWRAAVSALTRLDPAFALAAIGRLADEGVIAESWTLESFITTALDSGSLTIEAAIALLVLIENPDVSTIRKLASIAAAQQANGKLLLEEISRQGLACRIAS
jgi:hypothetical protein